MPSSRPLASARVRRMLFACAGLAFAGGVPAIGSDDNLSERDQGARVEIIGGRTKAGRVELTSESKDALVEINGGRIESDLTSDSKDALVELNGYRSKSRRAELTSDSKSALVEINGGRNKTAQVEINGRRAESRFRQGRRYLFAQEQALEEPPLPPSQFNPDPGGGNLAEPIEPPDLFPPILPQPPEYGDEPIPRSLGLPRRGVREMEPQRRKLDYETYPDSENGVGLLPGSEPVPNRWFIGFGRWQRYADPSSETPYQSGALRLWHPYLQSTLKGDAPIIGQDIFLNLTLNDFFQFEARRLPIPSGVSTARPNSSEFFGRSEQLFFLE